jgi:peptidoglycan/xylan/chitin deacetylase (PgdA/CDA1 family)
MSFMPLYPLLYRLLKPAFSHCLWSGSSDTATLALTFDDGPHPQYTPALLEVLHRHQVCATFFLLGTAVEQHPELVRTIHQQGHWIGLHGYDHQAFVGLSDQDLQRQLAQTQTAIAQSAGVIVRDVRPPYGIFTPQILSRLNQWHYRPVMWSVIAEDWLLPGIEVVVERIVRQVHHGAIVVLHDGLEGGSTVAATVERLIPQLQAQGYQFVTIDQMQPSD